jgi:hypothetical protein
MNTSLNAALGAEGIKLLVECLCLHEQSLSDPTECLPLRTQCLEFSVSVCVKTAMILAHVKPSSDEVYTVCLRHWRSAGPGIVGEGV